jgi:hypothetical protein
VAADGTGHFTAGEADRESTGSGPSGVQMINTSTSSYSVGSDNRGCATFVTASGTTLSTRFVLGAISSGVATDGRIAEFDSPFSSTSFIGAGEVALQTTSAFAGGLSGSYAVAYEGWDPTAKTRVASAGALSIASSLISNFELDQNDAGTLTNFPLGQLAGSVTGFDSSGRATVSFTLSGNPSFSGVLYMVSTGKAFYLEASGSPQVEGVFLQQAIPSGGFSNSSLASGTMVLYANGAEASAEDAFIGLVQNANGTTAGFTLYEDDGSGNTNNGTGWQALGTASTFSCTYTVAANGRTTLMGAAPQCASAPLLYLTGTNGGTALSLTGNVDYGMLEPQASLTFNNSVLSGSFFLGPLGAVSQSQPTELDLASLGSGMATLTTDITSTTNQEIDETSTASYTVNSNGTVTLVQNSVPVVQMIIINANRFVILNNITGVYPYVLIGQQ